MPSAKYSCSGSPLILVKGKTATDGFLSGGARGSTSDFAFVPAEMRKALTGRVIFLSVTSPRSAAEKSSLPRISSCTLQLGQVEEAREEAKLYLARTPQFRISHWFETQPYRDLAMRDRVLEGLRKAGLPE